MVVGHDWESPNVGMDASGDREDKFPEGMRVIVVDDDPVCLDVLERMLTSCKYEVTKTTEAATALKILREKKDYFDIVVSDAKMPGIDGYKLLEIVGPEFGLPVIIVSSHGDTESVMKGIMHGACDVLQKPVTVEVFKNIWQHVLRRRPDRYKGILGEPIDRSGSTENNGQTTNVDKKGKGVIRENEDDEEVAGEGRYDNEDLVTRKKRRVVWSPDLHAKFIEAVNELGLDKAVPKKILDLMNVQGITRENVASHLQKYRLYLKKMKEEANQQSKMAAAFASRDPSYHIAQYHGLGGYRPLTSPGQMQSTLGPFQPPALFSRMSHPAASSTVFQPSHHRTLSDPLNSYGKFAPTFPPMNHYGGQSAGLNRMPYHIDNNFCSSSISGAGISTPCSFSSGASMLLPNHLQTQTNSASLANAASLYAAPSTMDSFNMAVHGSSNVLLGNRGNSSWPGATQAFNFPTTSLPLGAPIHHDQFPVNTLNASIGNVQADFSSPITSAPLGDPRSGVQAQADILGDLVYVPDGQRWEESGQGYNHNLGNPLGDVDYIVSTNALTMDGSGTVRTHEHSIRSNNDALNQIANEFVSLGNNHSVESLGGDFEYFSYPSGPAGPST